MTARSAGSNPIARPDLYDFHDLVTSETVLAAVSAWRFSGYHIVLFSTGLTSIPTEMMEAARIDGANAWHQLWRIQLPNIWLVFSFVMFDCIRGTPQCFDIPFIMTNGGPGYASSTFTLYTIDTAFKYNSFGMAATMAVAIMAIVILVYVFQNVVLKKVFNQEEAA